VYVSLALLVDWTVAARRKLHAYFTLLRGLKPDGQHVCRKLWDVAAADVVVRTIALKVEEEEGFQMGDVTRCAKESTARSSERFRRLVAGRLRLQFISAPRASPRCGCRGRDQYPNSQWMIASSRCSKSYPQCSVAAVVRASHIFSVHRVAFVCCLCAE
jgi:hypothetical protein